MDDSGKELLAELTDAMSRMENNPEGLAGWLLSNYRLTKIGEAEPTQFFGNKPQQELLPHEQLANSKSNSYQDFIKRTGQNIENADKIKSKISPAYRQQQAPPNQPQPGPANDRMAQLRNIVNEIQHQDEYGDVNMGSDYGGQSGPYEEEMYTEEDFLRESQETARELISNTSQQQTHQPPAMDNSMMIGDSEVPPEMLQHYANAVASQVAPFDNVQDPVAQKRLQEDRLKRLRASEALASGVDAGTGRPGSFRRSS